MVDKVTPSSSKSEVERKFLVEGIPDGLSRPSGVEIDQGYLAIDEQSEVRVRRAGERFTITVKRGHGLSREETEVDLDRAGFDDLWPQTEGRRVTKIRSRIDLDGRLIAELDTYAGALEGLSVVEVEFETDQAASAFDPPGWFGRELTGDPAWANQSLAVSGKPEKQLEYRLRPGEEPVAGVMRVISTRAAQAAAAVRRAGESGDSAEDVHEARKSLKKARSALRLLRGVIPDGERETANAGCRDAATRLSGPRDAEVKIATLGLVSGKGANTRAPERWQRELEAEAAFHRVDLTADNLAEVARSLDRIAGEFRSRKYCDGSEAIPGNLGRGYRRGRRAMKEARRSSGPEAFHDWRKRAKDLRYQLEILEPRLPEKLTAIRKNAEELADQLGDLHDLDVLAVDLNRRELEPGQNEVYRELIAEARDRQAATCFETGKATYSLKPKGFTNRIGEEMGGGD